MTLEAMVIYEIIQTVCRVQLESWGTLSLKVCKEEETEGNEE